MRDVGGERGTTLGILPRLVFEAQEWVLIATLKAPGAIYHSVVYDTKRPYRSLEQPYDP